MRRVLRGFCTALLLLMTFNVFTNVVMRYVFNNSLIGLQELEWHLFSAMFLIGISYVLLEDGHVRVDIFHQKFSHKIKQWVDLLGNLFFVIPLATIIFYYGIDFSYQAFLLGEESGDPGGLKYRFLIKSVIPFSALLLILASLTSAYQNARALKKSDS